jgi:hypothetical protein
VASKREFVNPPAGIAAKVRAICAALPETEEKVRWTGGSLFRIRGGTFASLVCEVRGGVPVTTVTFHARGADLDALLHVGHPFYAGWGGGLIALVLDDATDWDEAAEVLADSYCLLAPKKLSKLVNGGDTPRR